MRVVWQVRSLTGHGLGSEGLCLCTVDEHGALAKDDDGKPIIEPGCPVTGHSDQLSSAEFSDDGAQVISCSPEAGEVLVWDTLSGRRVCQLDGCEFALVEGLSDERKRGRHILTANDNMLLIYECGKEQQHGQDGAGAVPVASFKAPTIIDSLQCHGAAICVGCVGGKVFFLSAPFLAA